jgi:hypothetical protein
MAIIIVYLLNFPMLLGRIDQSSAVYKSYLIKFPMCHLLQSSVYRSLLMDVWVCSSAWWKVGPCKFTLFFFGSNAALTQLECKSLDSMDVPNFVNFQTPPSFKSH